MTSCPNCNKALEEDSLFCPACGTKLGEAACAEGSLLGTTLNGKYRVISELGRGAMGTVYLGEHLSLKKQVALKVLHVDLQIGQEALVRFQREGIAAGKFNHPGAIQIFDFDVEGKETWYLAMEYVEGVTLKRYLAERGPLDATTAIGLTGQVLSVLAEAHRQGIVHRDLKPENIMVRQSALEQTSIKVLDFGLSKLLDQPANASMMTQTGRIMGTPMYMSPEQCTGKEVDHRTDLYSAGLILYELLAGATPFQAESMTEVLVKHMSENAPSIVDQNPNLAVPEGVEGVLGCALSKDPDERYASATEMLAALQAVDVTRIAKPGHAPGRTPGTQAPRGAGGRGAKRWVVPFGLFGLAALIVMAVFLWPSPRPNLPRLSQQSAAVLQPIELQYVELLDKTRRSLRAWNLDEALVRAGDAIAMPCRDSEAYLLRARVYEARGDLDTARADFTEALSLDPNYAEARAGLGWLALSRGEPALAKQAFEAASALDGESPAALAGMGAVQLGEEHYQVAEALLMKAIAGDSSLVRAHVYLGRTRLRLGRHQAAADAFIQGKREDARSWESYAGLAQAYLALDRNEEAETQWLEALRLQPESWQLKLELASMYVDRGRHADAKPLVIAGIEKRPESGALHVLRALIGLEEGDGTQEVIASLEAGLASGADSFDARMLLGIQYMELGNSELAEAQFVYALLLDEDNSQALTNLGLAYAGQDRYADAVIELERAAQVDTGSQFLHLTLGVLYMDFIGNRDKALKHLSTYQELGGRDGRVAGWLKLLRG